MQTGKPKSKTGGSDRAPRRELLKPAVPQATGYSYEPDRGDPDRARRRAAEQEARAIERLRASAPDRAQPQYVPYEYMPEGGGEPENKPTHKKKKKKKRWPKPKLQSQPLPDYSAVPSKVSTRGHAQKYTPRESGEDVIPTPERVVRRAVEQEARAVERLRTRPKRASGLYDQNAGYIIEPANKSVTKQALLVIARPFSDRLLVITGTTESRKCRRTSSGRERTRSDETRWLRTHAIARVVTRAPCRGW